MGGTLSAPIKSKSFERKANGAVRISSCSMQGFRSNMEDNHTIKLSLSQLHENSIFVGVYDGHSGDRASAYLKQELWKRLGKEETLNKESITRVLKDIDLDFLSSTNAFRNHGSTAIFAIITPESHAHQLKSDVYIKKREYNVKLAWIGDSRAFIESQGCITDDHKPTLPHERRRIEAAGGVCKHSRVDGKLALSRAVGDFSFKDNMHLSYEAQKVVAIPQIIEFQVVEGERMLIACDGLTEQMPNERMMEILSNELKEQADPAHALANLFEACLNSGSQDNMSAVMVEFMNGGNYGFGRAKTWVPGPLFRSRRDPNFVCAYMQDAAKHGVKDGVELRTTAYGQDIREIRKTTNDPDLIFKIEKVIANLDGTMFKERCAKKTKVWKSRAIMSELPLPSIFKADRSQLAEVELEKPTVSTQTDYQKYSFLQKAFNNEESSVFEESLHPIGPAHSLGYKHPTSIVCEERPLDCASLNNLIPSTCRAKCRVSALSFTQVTTQLDSKVHGNKLKNSKKLIGGGLNSSEGDMAVDFWQRSDNSISECYTGVMSIGKLHNQLVETSVSLKQDQKNISINLKRKRYRVREPFHVGDIDNC